jgi:copper(I)-binding protein
MFIRFMFPLIIAIFGNYAGGAESALSVHTGWIREAPPTASVLAGYMVIENDGAEPRKLVSAKSSAFESIELHRSVVRNGIASMVPQASVTIPPAGGQVAFRPGSYHLMMMNPTRFLRAGDKVTVILSFKNGEHLETMLPVRRAAGGE